MALDAAAPMTAQIRSYADGEIRVGEQRLREAFALDAQGTITPLAARHPQAIDAGGLAPLLAAQPEVVIVGWAGGQFFLPAAQRHAFLERRIGLEVMALGPACRTFNLLAADGRRVLALLFPEASGTEAGGPKDR
jgi:uncharacterized protein